MTSPPDLLHVIDGLVKDLAGEFRSRGAEVRVVHEHIENGTAIRMLPSNPAAASVSFLVGRAAMTLVIGEYATEDLYRTRGQSMGDFCEELVKYATAVAEGRFWEHHKTKPANGGFAVVSVQAFLDVEGRIVRPRGWAPGGGRRFARTSKSTRQYEAWWSDA